MTDQRRGIGGDSGVKLVQVEAAVLAVGIFFSYYILKSGAGAPVFFNGLFLRCEFQR